MISKPGIYLDIEAADYFADPCPEPSVTQSLIKTLLDRSPLHAKCEHPRLSPLPADDEEKYEKARAIGNVVHLLLLGRGKQLAIGEFDSWRTKEARVWRDAHQGQTIILHEHYETAVDLVSVAIDQLADRGLNFREFIGDSEVVLAWQDQVYDDTWCRTMIDHISPDRRHIFDLKTTEKSAAPHAIGPMVRDWAIQAAMHDRGLDVLDPDNAGRRTHTFIVIEQYPPYALCAYDLPESVLTMGRKALQIGLHTWARCMASGIWPAYPIETQLATLPGWQESRMLAREIEHEEQRREPAPQWDTLEEKRMDLPSDWMMSG